TARFTSEGKDVDVLWTEAPAGTMDPEVL
uniref:Uncharacterized protein n=1 Tax=Catagonus wagneri TaxID=51154 RepID=A0A8C3VLG3_9CETA